MIFSFRRQGGLQYSLNTCCIIIMSLWEAGNWGEVVNDPKSDSISRKHHGLIMKPVLTSITWQKLKRHKEMQINYQEYVGEKNLFLADKIKWLSLGNGRGRGLRAFEPAQRGESNTEQRLGGGMWAAALSSSTSRSDDALQSALCSTAATNHIRLLSSWHVAHGTKELKF